MIGVGLALGVRRSSVQAIVQGSGTALRMDASSFQLELQRNTVSKRVSTGIFTYSWGSLLKPPPATRFIR